MGWSFAKRHRPHYCDMPQHYWKVIVYAGDIIRCDCGKLWQCVRIDHGYPPYDVEPVMHWEVVNGLD